MMKQDFTQTCSEHSSEYADQQSFQLLSDKWLFFLLCYGCFLIVIVLIGPQVQ
ncbi:hypothetical protein BDW67DRAFT_157964 [Aspergillus spinulosporus]